MWMVTHRWQLDASTQQAQLLEEQLVQQLTHGWTDKEACQRFLDGILRACKDNKLHLSTQVLASAAAYLAQQQWWGSLDDLLRAQALPSLAMCPGLTLAVVQGGHFSLLTTTLSKVMPCLCPKVHVLLCFHAIAVVAVVLHCFHAMLLLPCHRSAFLHRLVSCSFVAQSRTVQSRAVRSDSPLQ